MATKKAGSTAKKSTTKKSTTATRPQTTKVTTVKAVATPRASTSRSVSRLPGNIVNIVIAEVIGTFILTLVAILSLQSVGPLYVGLTMLVLVLVIGGISGAHVNPAVTFGLWSARRLKSILLPFYWVAQFVGAMAAVVVLHLISNNTFGVSFPDFWAFNWTIFFVELIGTAVFLFGFVAVANRAEFTQSAKALGIGLSLAAGLLVGGSLLATVQSSVDTSKVTLANVPHELRVKAATVNPAVALASTESTNSQLQGSNSTKDEKMTSRLGIEVILGTLIGGALGANLFLVTSYRNRK